MADLNDLGVCVHVLKAAGIIYYSYVGPRLAISLKLCCTSSLVFCASTPSAPVALSRLLSVFLFGIIWRLVVGLAASLSYLSTPGFAFRLV